MNDTQAARLQELEQANAEHLARIRQLEGYHRDATDAGDEAAMILDGTNYRWTFGEGCGELVRLAQEAKARIADLEQRLAAAEKELREERYYCNSIVNGLEWMGDGYSWNPTHGDYRERVIDAVNRGAGAFREALAAAEQRAVDAEEGIRVLRGFLQEAVEFAESGGLRDVDDQRNSSMALAEWKSAVAALSPAGEAGKGEQP